MTNKAFIEGIVPLVMSLIGITEGVNIIRRQSQVVEEIFGPGHYIFAVSLVMMIVSIIYLISQYRKNLSIKKVAVTRQMRLRMINIVVVLGIYIVLIDIIGYLWATPVFFLLLFRVMGLKWLINVIMSMTISMTLYITFVHFLGMIFPRGILFS